MPPFRRTRRTPESRLVGAERRLAVTEGVAPRVQRIALPETSTTLRLMTFGPEPAPGETVTLLVHGATLSSAWWYPLVPHLPGPVAALDLPGHGLSDGFDVSRHDPRATLAAAVAAARRALGDPPLTLVGNSLGGMVALWTALAIPEAVERLVVLGAPGVAFSGGRVDPILGALAVPAVARFALAGRTPPALYGATVAQSIAEPSLSRRPELVAATYWATRRRAFRSTVPQLLAHALDFRDPREDAALTPAELARIQAPVLYVHGREEKYLPVEAGRRAVEAMADARLMEVDAGHVPWLADPAATAALWVQDTAAAA